MGVPWTGDLVLERCGVRRVGPAKHKPWGRGERFPKGPLEQPLWVIYTPKRKRGQGAHVSDLWRGGRERRWN